MLVFKKLVVALMCVVATIGSLSAQVQVIDLWNGKAPGATQSDEFKQNVDTTAGWVDKHSIDNSDLYFYPAPAEKATGTTVVICPGGGYSGLAIRHEGLQVAQWFNSVGITAFVLTYRQPDDAIMEDKSIGPLQDGQRAIRLVRRHAKEWGINPEKIGIMGFSAGGHVASTISTHYNEKVYTPVDSISARPDFSLLIYPVISMDSTITHWGSRVNLLGNNPSPEQVTHFSNELQVNAQTPPAFVVHSLDDDVVPVQNSIEYALAMKKHHVPCELHIYESGGHGYGMAPGRSTQSMWPEACCKWLNQNGFTEAVNSEK
ncbi:alpha/beta hydrolase [uncultured Draconibacterium sp.]|uniref:alpha/beta hydrolase n=1 Tax=uncultured Draconibacterium sp. TaxID=1573823 RepID=UPI0029C676B1|nr:alpha/beta hydrolase [uncultured Draconibacterium sp.]